jgi:hypothetical protein
VDWKRLVQFGLLGNSDLEQYAILRVGFFVCSFPRNSESDEYLIVL